MSQQDRQRQNTSIFTDVCQKFPTIPETMVLSIILHDLGALDLYNLPMQHGEATPPRLPHQTRTQCPQELLEQAITWAREPNLIFRHLYTYFSVLSVYFHNNPTIPLGFFRYLDHLQYLSGMHEWTRVHEYHIEFFEKRVLEMRNGDFSKWAHPDFLLMRKYGFDRGKVVPDLNQYTVNRIFYNGKVWGLVDDPARAAINCIIRRTLDPYAEKIQYVAQYKVTTHRLDMSRMPFGKPGQMFRPITNRCERYQFYDINMIRTRRHYSYEEGSNLPFLDVVAVLEDLELLRKRKKEEEVKLAAEKVQRRLQRIAHFKALLPRVGWFVSFWLDPRRFYRPGGKLEEDLGSHTESDIRKHVE